MKKDKFRELLLILREEIQAQQCQAAAAQRIFGE